MEVDFNTLLAILSNSARAAEMLLAWSNIHLMRYGLDPMTIIVRGPSLVLMGLAFSAARYSLVRVRSFASERMGSWDNSNTGGTYQRQLVYVTSGRGNRRR